MKQVQSETTLDQWIGQRKAQPAIERRWHWRVDGYKSPGARDLAQPRSWSTTGIVITSLSIAWFAITLPFRLVFRLTALLGRLTGIILGFLLMVVGMALWASPLFIVGIPIFVVGLVLTLRCVE
jgi:hypothetical protein